MTKDSEPVATMAEVEGMRVQIQLGPARARLVKVEL